MQATVGVFFQPVIDSYRITEVPGKAVCFLDSQMIYLVLINVS